MDEYQSPQEYATVAGNGTDFSQMSGANSWLSSFVNSDMQNRFWNAYESQMNRIYNANEAEKSRAWTKMMSDTTYQRAMNDLKEAGINPLYMFMGSGLGSAPSGQSASGSPANLASAGKSTNLLGKLAMIIIGMSKLLAGDPTGVTQIFGANGDLQKTIRRS